MSKRTDALDRILDDLTVTREGFGPAWARVQDQRRGLPAAANPNGSGHGGGSSSPVESALNLAGDGPTTGYQLPKDPAAVDSAETDKRLRRMEADALWLRSLVQRNTPHAPTSKDQAAVDRANDEADDCEHCTKAGVYEHATHTGNVAGNLPHPMRLCEFCYREVYRKGRLPRGEVLVERHRKGKNPMVRVEA